MIRHIVMFRLKGTPEEKLLKAESFRDALLALPASIECLRKMDVGINCNPMEKWDIVLTAEVDNMADLERYASHPLHIEAAAIIKDVKEDRACVDFEF